MDDNLMRNGCGSRAGEKRGRVTVVIAKKKIAVAAKKTIHQDLCLFPIKSACHPSVRTLGIFLVYVMILSNLVSYTTISV